MSANASGLHLGSTVTRIEGTPWRVAIHWHTRANQLVPAGIEIRCYGVEGDDPTDFWGGQERPTHEHPLLDPGEHSRAVSTDLLARRLKLGPLIAREAERLSHKLVEEADRTVDLHEGSAEVMRQVSMSAGGLSRATDDTYRLVAALYLRAQEGEHRSRPAVYVLERLVQDHRYPLDAKNESHRVKVRQWIGEARRRGYLPQTNNKKRGNEQ